ncbi:hypothetical protein DNJ95_11820 [Stutzerimonas kirkiae]|uniref:Uncharacterized protein n=1 Tax=Stutzerimonas kirkiae TaxID=2211392 RepID=A0A4Q9RE91_9GAMM|nr:hypothetical protein DNJ96_04350 [Stutzerimonas kirkiae]TBV01593.1 hypothetical protein DNJ95_11820 [Stutzerimonas kirkiae]
MLMVTLLPVQALAQVPVGGVDQAHWGLGGELAAQGRYRQSPVSSRMAIHQQGDGKQPKTALEGSRLDERAWQQGLFVQLSGLQRFYRSADRQADGLSRARLLDARCI